ncbi:S24 family peptidase [Campylobacter mucosalis]|uniref:S24 family peptidase n=1 Tax=Campylobacter mucosalis TaxID=202 RepID=UPI00147047F6|nr:S24 family peptidase [Campylobacter mucosalis]
MDDKVIFENMKKFFEVSSLEDVAEKMGYSRTTASTWRSKGLTSSVKLKFASMSVDKVEKPYKHKAHLRYFEDVTASAGYGSSNSSANFSLIPVSDEFLSKILKIPVKTYDVIRVFGDSMEPFAKDGDMVVVDLETEVKNGDIIIANINGDVYMKKFLRNSIHKEIKLTSLNSFYQDIVLKDNEIDELKIVGKVRCKFSIDMKIY